MAQPQDERIASGLTPRCEFCREPLVSEEERAQEFCENCYEIIANLMQNRFHKQCC